MINKQQNLKHQTSNFQGYISDSALSYTFGYTPSASGTGLHNDSVELRSSLWVLFVAACVMSVKIMLIPTVRYTGTAFVFDAFFRISYI
ncbi:hypothetical protein Ccrd_012632 [Cynara cardunculus var. scolymus]|uniref:Uncharacterized protein n=1 Tax=Cynara cardunculus var. scolymus TaxID=59895 RepID=A0A124SHB0_CYNCS|nr:hypothetical protein Ccrd_012632 [Cynara cardunculus var. scolymus]